MSELAVHWFVVILTVCAISYPAAWSYYFFKDKEGIGRPLSWMLLGEVAGRMAAFPFFLSSVLDFEMDNNAYTTAGIRTFVVLSGLITTIILIRYLRQVQHKGD